MGFVDIFIGRRKKKRKVTRSRQKIAKKEQVSQKSAAVEKIEDPVMTVSRQLTLLQSSMENMDGVVRSGFSGLRDDHHKILDEQATKQDIFFFREYLENQKQSLQAKKERIEREIELIDTDRKILDALEKRRKRSNQVAKELGIVRQYASERLNRMVDLGFVEKIKKGREVYYKVKKG